MYSGLQFPFGEAFSSSGKKVNRLNNVTEKHYCENSMKEKNNHYNIKGLGIEMHQGFIHCPDFFFKHKYVVSKPESAQWNVAEHYLLFFINPQIVFFP